MSTPAVSRPSFHAVSSVCGLQVAETERREKTEVASLPDMKNTLALTSY